MKKFYIPILSILSIPLALHFVAPLAHDTCDWSLQAFQEVLGDEYHSLQVGERLCIKE